MSQILASWTYVSNWRTHFLMKIHYKHLNIIFICVIYNHVHQNYLHCYPALRITPVFDVTICYSIFLLYLKFQFFTIYTFYLAINIPTCGNKLVDLRKRLFTFRKFILKWSISDFNDALSCAWCKEWNKNWSFNCANIVYTADPVYHKVKELKDSCTNLMSMVSSRAAIAIQGIQEYVKRITRKSIMI